MALDQLQPTCSGSGEVDRWESGNADGGDVVVPWPESNVRVDLRRVLRNHGFPKPS